MSGQFTLHANLREYCVDFRAYSLTFDFINMKATSVISGAFWMTAATMVSKFSSFIAQLVLGWLLAKEDFGLYALAVSLAASVSVLRNGGSDQILIQRGAEYNDLAPAVVQFSFIFNIAAGVVLLIFSGFAAKIYNEPLLVYLLAFIAVSIVVTTPELVLKSRLAIGKGFRQLSIVAVLSGLFRQTLAVLMALGGAGVFSFVVPMALEPMFAAILLYFIVREWPRGRNVRKGEFKRIFNSSKWVMLSNFATAMLLNGQYFVIGLFQDRVHLGVYFFGMQLVVSTLSIITTTVNQVLFPGLSKLAADESAHRTESLRALKVGFVVGILASFAIFSLAEPAIHYFWAGKWDEAIACAEILSFIIPAMVINRVSFSIFGSRGLWRTRFFLLAGAAVSDIFVAGVAASQGDLVKIAIAVTTTRILYSIFVVGTVHMIVDSGFPKGILFCIKLATPALIAMILLELVQVDSLDISEFFMRMLFIMLPTFYYIYYVWDELPVQLRRRLRS